MNKLAVYIYVLAMPVIAGALVSAMTVPGGKIAAGAPAGK
jgi:hypothetical protein